MTIFTLRWFAFLVFAGFANAEGTEDAVCMLHKDLSLIIKPDAPSDKGLTNWDKNFITDDQSGPFYDHETEVKKEPSLVQSPSLLLNPTASSSLNQETIFLWLVLGLVISVLLVVVITCLISWQTVDSAGVTKMSCGVFSQAISVFCAFLIFNALKDLVRSTGRKYLLQTGLVLLLFFVVVAHLQLFITRRWPLTLVATGMVYSYAISFAIIDVFELAKQVSTFTQANFLGRVGMLLFVVIALGLFIVLSTSMRELSEGCLKSNEQCRGWWKICCCCCVDVDAMVNDGSWNEWKKRVSKSEDQLAAVAIGYLISQVAEHAIVMASPDGHWSQALALVTASFALLSMFVSRRTSTGPSNRFSLAMLSSFLMATAWCLFHVAQWEYNGNTGFIGKSLGLQPKSLRTSFLVALTTSFIALALYMIICSYSLYFHTAPWGHEQLSTFQALAAAMGFALALPWVSCFTIWIDALPKFSVSEPLPAAVIVCVLVLPIWGAYLLPRTNIGKTVEGQWFSVI